MQESGWKKSNIFTQKIKITISYSPGDLESPGELSGIKVTYPPSDENN